MRRDELEEYDPFDEGVFCRSRFWLFISYVVSFASVVGAVWVLLGHYALNPDVTTVWPGIAGLFQVAHALPLPSSLRKPNCMQYIKEHCKQPSIPCAQTSHESTFWQRG